MKVKILRTFAAYNQLFCQGDEVDEMDQDRVEKLNSTRLGALLEVLEDYDAGNTDFESMTKAELLELADGRGIPGLSATMRKADIITAIKGAP